MNDIKVNGTQIFMGIEIPVIEGGFGENCRVVSAKTISQIHDMRLSDVNASINRLIRKKRIKDNVDFVNLLSETVSLRNFAKSLGLVSSNRTKDGFILSERGYSKLVKAMDDDKSWDIMDNFIDEYFTMRQIINSEEQEKAECLLAIYNGGQNAVVASKRLSELEVKEATAPLLPKAAFMMLYQFQKTVFLLENLQEHFKIKSKILAEIKLWNGAENKVICVQVMI